MLSLKIYLVAQSPKACREIALLTKMLEKWFKDRYTLEIIDLLEQPELALKDQIFATPCVVKVSPGSPRTFVGSLDNPMTVIAGLKLDDQNGKPSPTDQILPDVEMTAVDDSTRRTTH